MVSLNFHPQPNGSNNMIHKPLYLLMVIGIVLAGQFPARAQSSALTAEVIATPSDLAVLPVGQAFQLSLILSATVSGYG